MSDNKYVVFKVENWEGFRERVENDITEVFAAMDALWKVRVGDGTVIRQQDILAPYALLAYAGAAQAHELYDIAEVFLKRAVEAERLEGRKEPD